MKIGLWSDGSQSVGNRKCVNLNGFKSGLYGLWMMSDCDEPKKVICNKFVTNTFITSEPPKSTDLEDINSTNMEAENDGLLWIILCIIMFVYICKCNV